METAIPNLSEVVIKLPLNFFQKKEIGFKFGTLSYAFMCNLFTPAIDFHQIDEIRNTKPNEMLVKIITGGAMAYSFIHKEKCIVNEKLVSKWLTELPAKERDFFMDKINCAILNGKLGNTTLTEHMKQKQVKKK